MAGNFRDFCLHALTGTSDAPDRPRHRSISHKFRTVFRKDDEYLNICALDVRLKFANSSDVGDDVKAS